MIDSTIINGAFGFGVYWLGWFVCYYFMYKPMIELKDDRINQLRKELLEEICPKVN